MGKGKLAKFADMATYDNVFQYPYGSLEHADFPLKGHWREQYFKNDNPIVLELGCGKGEYTVGLAKRYPNVNFIGVDIKGARMWTGATQAVNEGLKNVAFLRTNIEIIDQFFSAGEVQEIWLTFCDPQMKKPHKRLTSTWFLERYRRFLVNNGIIHLKTDSNFLFTYTTLLVSNNALSVEALITDLYNPAARGTAVDSNAIAAFTEAASIQTYYESMWLARGINIKYMKFRLPHEGQLEEPDVEIELDDYRSYHRDKRSSKDKAK